MLSSTHSPVLLCARCNFAWLRWEAEAPEERIGVDSQSDLERLLECDFKCQDFSSVNLDGKEKYTRILSQASLTFNEQIHQRSEACRWPETDSTKILVSLRSSHHIRHDTVTVLGIHILWELVKFFEIISKGELNGSQLLDDNTFQIDDNHWQYNIQDSVLRTNDRRLFRFWVRPFSRAPNHAPSSPPFPPGVHRFWPLKTLRRV